MSDVLRALIGAIRDMGVADTAVSEFLDSVYDIQKPLSEDVYIMAEGESTLCGYWNNAERVRAVWSSNSPEATCDACILLNFEGKNDGFDSR